MKKLLILLCAFCVAALFFQGTPENDALAIDSNEAALPDNIKAIVDKKCYGCHNANSKNEKGKAKLDWDALDKMKKSKRMAAMHEITEVLEKGEMPPQKFVANKPEAALTQEELDALKEWSAGKKKKTKS